MLGNNKKKVNMNLFLKVFLLDFVLYVQTSRIILHGSGPWVFKKAKIRMGDVSAKKIGEMYLISKFEKLAFFWLFLL